jgi:hypothetical protein
MNYFVILFKNNKKKKILKSFITENKAIEAFLKIVVEKKRTTTSGQNKFYLLPKGN